jgi:hypothetical protein
MDGTAPSTLACGRTPTQAESHESFAQQGDADRQRRIRPRDPDDRRRHEQYVRKGDRLYVEGRIEYSTTEDDKGGQRYWTDINVQEMVMLGGSSGGGGGAQEGGGAPQRRRQPAHSGPPQGSPFDSDDDDLPF